MNAGCMAALQAEHFLAAQEALEDDRTAQSATAEDDAATAQVTMRLSRSVAAASVVARMKNQERFGWWHALTLRHLLPALQAQTIGGPTTAVDTEQVIGSNEKEAAKALLQNGRSGAQAQRDAVGCLK